MDKSRLRVLCPSRGSTGDCNGCSKKGMIRPNTMSRLSINYNLTHVDLSHPNAVDVSPRTVSVTRIMCRTKTVMMEWHGGPKSGI